MNTLAVCLFVKVMVNRRLVCLCCFLKIGNSSYFMNDMPLCLMPLHLVSIGLLLNKRMNYLTRPIDGNRAFSKGH